MKHQDKLDGLDLLPMLAKGKPLPERTRYWRFWGQSAARKGDWKFLKMGNQQSFLFNLANDPGETKNLLKKNPEIATRLEKSATTWARDLKPAGLPNTQGNIQESFFYHHFFKTPLPKGINPKQNPFRNAGKKRKK